MKIYAVKSESKPTFQTVLKRMERLRMRVQEQTHLDCELSMDYHAFYFTCEDTRVIVPYDDALIINFSNVLAKFPIASDISCIDCKRLRKCKNSGSQPCKDWVLFLWKQEKIKTSLAALGRIFDKSAYYISKWVDRMGYAYVVERCALCGVKVTYEIKKDINGNPFTTWFIEVE